MIELPFCVNVFRFRLFVSLTIHVGQSKILVGLCKAEVGHFII